MAYGLKYISRFKNRIQRDIFRIEVWEKDFEGSETELTSAESSAFVANFPTGDTDILTPIKSAEFTLSFIGGGQYTLFYSATADINVSAILGYISIPDQPDAHGIMPGMKIVFDNTTYTITEVDYSDILDLIVLHTRETLVDANYIAEPFEVLEVLSIENFYSDDDQQFRVDFYFESDENGGGTEKLLYTSYLIQDGSSEPLTDIKHPITFKATDNIGLLKNKFWNETSNSPDATVALGAYIREALQETGLYSHDTTIDMSLPLRLYNNLFENTIDDRGDDPVNDPFAQIILYPNLFKDNDNTWQDLYSILEQVLKTMNADILMCDGYWNVRRIPEYKLFTDGEIPGTEYIYNGSGTDVTAVTLEPLATIQRSTGEVVPVLEDQVKSILRPLKYVQTTFDYQQPVLIDNQELQLPPGATPYYTATVDDLRYDRYSLATYFPTWIQRNGDASYLEVVTDTSVTPEQETGRYIYKPSDFGVKSGVQFNPILVSENDSFEFSLNFNTYHEDGFFWVYFRLIAFDGTVYSLNNHHDLSDNLFLQWDEVTPDTDWYSDPYGVYSGKDAPEEQWATFDMFQYVDNPNIPILIPKDGVLLIEVDGNSHNLGAPPPSGSGGSGGYTTKWRDIRLNMNQLISNSTQIIGHVHTDERDATLAKAVEENTITIDDSPRNTIAGTLFTDATTALEYTDTDTGEVTDLGTLYVTKTTAWHRAQIAEALRLGNITTQEREQLRYTARFPIEGTFKNIRYDTDKFISPLTLFQFDFIPDKFFIAASMEIDYMECTFKAMLVEVFKNDETDFSDTYTFNYIYETE